jgi:hypothetical protein
MGDERALSCRRRLLGSTSKLQKPAPHHPPFDAPLNPDWRDPSPEIVSSTARAHAL